MDDGQTSLQHSRDKMTPQQRTIYDFVRSKGEATKKEISEIADNYYCNGEKHVGDRLSRMVKAGLLVRLKKGVFKVGRGKAHRPEPVDENQIKLF